MSLVELDREQWLREHGASPNGATPAPAPIPSKPIPWWTRVSRLAYGAAAVVAVAAVLIVVVLARRPAVTVHTYQTVVAASVVKGVPLRGVTAAVDVRSDHTTRVHFTNLPVLPPSLAYELWLIPAHGSPVPVDGFEVRAGQAFSQSYGKDASGFSAAAVSIERAPGHWPAPSPNGVAIEVMLGA
jgi:anti-sigma-K factor RskA